MAITDATKLDLYNAALRRIGDRAISSLTEAVESRRVLDQAWKSGGVVTYLLEGADWNFARRAVSITASISADPRFGFSYAFEKPADLVRLISLSADAGFAQPLKHSEFVEESAWWLSNYAPLYVLFVSSNDDLGFNDAAWSEAFRELIEMKLAYEISLRLTESEGKQQALYRAYDRALTVAKSRNAISDGVKFPPHGGWVMSRGRGSRYNGH